MKYLYMIIAMILIMYIFKRKFDFLSIAAISFVVYTANLVSGIVWIPKGELFYYYENVGVETYVIVLLQLILILVYIMLSDKVRWKPFSLGTRKRNRTRNENREKFAYTVLLAMVIFVSISNILKIGPEVFTLHKSVVASKMGPLYGASLWLNLMIFAYAVDENLKLHQLGSIIVLTIYLFIGSRSLIAVALVVFLILKWKDISRSFTKNLKLYLSGTVLAGLLFVYKEIYRDVRALDISIIVNKLLNVDTYLNAFTLGESSVVMSTYNYVIQSGYRLDVADSIARVVSIIPFANRFITTPNNIRFSSIVKNEIFEATYGLANSFWGETYAMFGYIGIILFTIIWLVLLRYGSKLLHSKKQSKYFMLVFSSYISFYIHRLDFLQVVGAFKILLLGYLIWMALYYLTRLLIKPNKSTLVMRKN